MGTLSAYLFDDLTRTGAARASVRSDEAGGAAVDAITGVVAPSPRGVDEWSAIFGNADCGGNRVERFNATGLQTCQPLSACANDGNTRSIDTEELFNLYAQIWGSSPTNGSVESTAIPTSAADQSRSSIRLRRAKRRAAAASGVGAVCSTSASSLRTEEDLIAIRKKQRRVKNRESVERCRLKQRMRLKKLEQEREELHKENEILRKLLGKVDQSGILAALCC